MNGQWSFHGVARTFHNDGTFTSKNGSVGYWKITEDQVQITMGTGHFRFPFPLKPDGTHGEQYNGRKVVKDSLFQVSPKASSKN